MKVKINLIAILLIWACQVNAQSDKEVIETVLDNWHKAAAEANFDSYFGLMTEEAVFIGTDATENWGLDAFKQFSKPYFDRGKAWSFEARERNIYLSPDSQFAWFDELLETWMGICRGSGVLTKASGEWKIAHYVLSATIPNDDMDEVIQIKKEKDSLQLLQLKNK